MTSRDGAVPSRAPIAFLRLTAPGVFGPALATLRGLFRARPPDAAALSDQQLADIGLMRANLPDHHGWRR